MEKRMETNYIVDKQTRICCLDVYKGICILFIIITHHNWTHEQRLHMLFPFWIEMAVPVFMVITGYVYANSSANKNIRLFDSYHPRQILMKWMRYTLPFIPAWMLGVVGRIWGKGRQFTPVELIVDFMEGGIGPGSYYYPVLLQTVLAIPIIIWIINQLKGKGLVGLFVFNLIFEYVKFVMNMSPALYRLCMLRYVFILSFGCYLFKTGHIHKRIYYITGLIGAIFIVYYQFLGHVHSFINMWTGTSVIAVLFITPLMERIIDISKVENYFLECLGKASYEIFLVQMIFYTAGDDFVRKVIPSTFLQVFINILICCSVGVLYYRIEYPISMRITNRINNIIS